MMRVLAISGLTACLAAVVACGGSATTPSSTLPAAATIGFNGLGGDGTSVMTYAESGFTVSAMSGDWSVRATYGNPAPFMQFWAQGGTAVSGEIQVRASGSPFYLASVDLYSSTTPIPYIVKGIRRGATVLSVSDTLPNTFGNFRTVFNPTPAVAIDTLSILLTNAAAPCCRNPMGLDTIVLTTTPGAAPATFSLSGRVTDSGTGAGIGGATVSVADGPNARKSAATDASGTYRLTALQQSGFTVTASALNYVSQSKGVTLTSDQALSFALTRQPAPPPPPPPPAGATIIGFNGLTANEAPISSYAESGFTLSTSGEWVASTTYGNPAPFVQFFAAAGSTVTAEIRVTAGGSVFNFHTVDLYSSTTTIPYTITGLRNSSAVFSLAGTLPNTFGNFRTVANPDSAAAIDTLSIVLTNTSAAPRNPMGLDTIVLTR